MPKTQYGELNWNKTKVIHQFVFCRQTFTFTFYPNMNYLCLKCNPQSARTSLKSNNHMCTQSCENPKYRTRFLNNEHILLSSTHIPSCFLIFTHRSMRSIQVSYETQVYHVKDEYSQNCCITKR